MGCLLVHWIGYEQGRDSMHADTVAFLGVQTGVAVAVGDTIFTKQGLARIVKKTMPGDNPCLICHVDGIPGGRLDATR